VAEEHLCGEKEGGDMSEEREGMVYKERGGEVGREREGLRSPQSSVSAQRRGVQRDS
jgi:hypothetical protein